MIRDQLPIAWRAFLLARRMNGFGSFDEPVTAMVLGADDQGEFIEARIPLSTR
jgi:hypothetical protein